MWDVATGQCLRVAQGHSNSLYAVDWSPAGTHLVSGGTDRMVTIYALDVAQPTSGTPRVLQGHSDIVLGVGWSPDGHRLASSEWDNLVHVWDATAGAPVQLLQHLEDTRNYFSALAWGPDGRLACGSYRQSVLVWDERTKSSRWLDHQRPTWVRTVAWRSDGRQLAGGDEYGTIYVWNADDHTLVRAMADVHNTVMCLAWEPEEASAGARLASGGLGNGGGELFIWNTVSGECLHTVAGHPVNVHAVAWGSQKDIVISGDSEGTLRWWHLQRGDCLRVHKAHEGSVQSLRRSPDGTKLASCGDDGAIRIWDLDSGEPLQTLRRDRPYERMDITGVTGLTTAQVASLKALGAVETLGRVPPGREQ